MMTPFAILATVCGLFVGMLLMVAGSAAVRGDVAGTWWSRSLALLFLVMAMSSLFYIHRAEAANVAEIPGVAVFTDEHGECPRLYRVAKDPRGNLGCWTIGEHDRAIRIEWADGRVEEYSETRFNIYAR